MLLHLRPSSSKDAVTRSNLFPTTYSFSAAISAAKKTTTAWPLAFELFEQMAEDRLQAAPGGSTGCE